MTDVIERRTVKQLKFRIALDHRQSYVSKRKNFRENESTKIS